MRQFYYVFSKENWSTLSTNLSWSHYSELLSIDNIAKINYYIKINIEQKLSVRQLREKIKNREYERLDETAREKLITKEDTSLVDLIKNPILIKNSINKKIISEKTLQKIILEDIPSFLQELGNGFSFIKNEYKIKIGIVIITSIYCYIPIYLIVL